MTLLRTFRAHTGGLLRIKSQLFWYGGRGLDSSPGRICLVLGAGVGQLGVAIAAATTAPAVGAYADDTDGGTAVLLLIDGCPYWVWVAREDVEIL